jgi:hypothetical protein
MSEIARPSAVTVILGRVAVAFTSKVPFLTGFWSFSKLSFPWQQGIFAYPPGHTVKIEGPG